MLNVSALNFVEYLGKFAHAKNLRVNNGLSVYQQHGLLVHNTARRLQILRDEFDSWLEQFAYEIYSGWLLTSRVTSQSPSTAQSVKFSV